MKLSRSIGGLAGAIALSCSLGLVPQEAGASVLLTGCAGGDFGDNCSLAELAVAGSSITINVNSNVVFNQFGFDPLGLNAAAILVTGLDIPYHPGIAFVASSSPTEGFAEDFFVAFSVSSNGSQIHGGNLAVTPRIGTPINGFFDVFVDLDAPVVPTMNVDCDLSAPSCELTASTSSAYVSAFPNVGLGTLGASDINSISVQVAVPEPGSLALLALGLAGLGASARRRKQSAAA